MMTQIYIIDWALGLFAGFIVWNIYLKPIAERKIRKKLDPVLLNIYKRIDSNMPAWLGVISGSQMWKEIRWIILEESPQLTSEEADKAAEIVIKDFDPRAATDALKDLGFTDAKHKETTS